MMSARARRPHSPQTETSDEDVTTNRIFLHIPEIGTVCGRVDVHVEIAQCPLVMGFYDGRIAVDECLKNPHIEVASKLGAVWSNDRV